MKRALIAFLRDYWLWLLGFGFLGPYIWMTWSIPYLADPLELQLLEGAQNLSQRLGFTASAFSSTDLSADYHQSLADQAPGYSLLVAVLLWMGASLSQAAKAIKIGFLLLGVLSWWTFAYRAFLANSLRYLFLLFVCQAGILISDHPQSLILWAFFGTTSVLMTTPSPLKFRSRTNLFTQGLILLMAVACGRESYFLIIALATFLAFRKSSSFKEYLTSVAWVITPTLGLIIYQFWLWGSSGWLSRLIQVESLSNWTWIRSIWTSPFYLDRLDWANPDSTVISTLAVLIGVAFFYTGWQHYQSRGARTNLALWGLASFLGIAFLCTSANFITGLQDIRIETLSLCLAPLGLLSIGLWADDSLSMLWHRRWLGNLARLNVAAILAIGFLILFYQVESNSERQVIYARNQQNLQREIFRIRQTDSEAAARVFAQKAEVSLAKEEEQSRAKIMRLDQLSPDSQFSQKTWVFFVVDRNRASAPQVSLPVDQANTKNIAQLNFNRRDVGPFTIYFKKFDPGLLIDQMSPSRSDRFFSPIRPVPSS